MLFFASLLFLSFLAGAGNQALKKKHNIKFLEYLSDFLGILSISVIWYYYVFPL